MFTTRAALSSTLFSCSCAAHYDRRITLYTDPCCRSLLTFHIMLGIHNINEFIRTEGTLLAKPDIRHEL